METEIEELNQKITELTEKVVKLDEKLYKIIDQLAACWDFNDMKSALRNFI